MSAFSLQNSKYLERIERGLAEILNRADILPQLRESMGYSVRAGGKRLRPCMALACCDMMGGDVQEALPYACALELIHTYSLIHDDLPCMDDDDYRRGKLTNHKVFGEAQAVLAGDGLLSLAFETMLEASVHASDPKRALAAMQAVARGAGVRGMVAGQALDLAAEQTEIRTEEQLRAIHTKKTGALIVASLLVGAQLAGGSNEQLAAAERFGECYGLLFQITDDILDYAGDAAQVGKTLGKDARENKLTYVGLYGLDGARAAARAAAEQAGQALAPFGERAGYFAELTALTLRRDK